MDELKEIIGSLSEKQVDLIAKIALLIKNETESNEKSRLMSTNEAAEVLGVTSATIRSYIKNGELEGRKLSQRKMVVTSDSVESKRLAQTRF